MPENFLITYKRPGPHNDPDFKNMLYGECGRRAKTLQSAISKGSHIFFHTSIDGIRYITAYLVVRKVYLHGSVPSYMHSDAVDDDLIICGDKTLSKYFPIPLVFDRKLAIEIFPEMNFSKADSGERSVWFVINSATRSQRRLSDRIVTMLKSKLSNLNPVLTDAASPIAPPGLETPQRKETFNSNFSRDPNVANYVLRLAKGICAGCGHGGPFQNDNGEPFLETHHVVSLCDGGPDQMSNIVALCPNCHRRAHYSKDRYSFKQKLIKIIGLRDKGKQQLVIASRQWHHGA